MLMSIKTKYAIKIFEGSKKYEYRRKNINKEFIGQKIYIYSSKDDKAIIGYIIVEEVLSGLVGEVLRKTKNENNIELIKYFKNASIAYALKIANATKFNKPIPLEMLKQINPKFTPPEFYKYILKSDALYNYLKMYEIKCVYDILSPTKEI